MHQHAFNIAYKYGERGIVRGMFFEELSEGKGLDIHES